MLNIWDKKIILWGNPKIKKDFAYLFKELDIDEESVLTNKSLNELNNGYENCLIVLCDKSTNLRTEEIFPKKRMKHGEDYAYLEDFFTYYNPMFLERGKRKLAIWGTGNYGERLWNILENKGIASEVDFFVDNAKDKKTFKGKRVVSPIDIKGRKDLYVIVATCKYQWEIYRQLEEYGFDQKKDYVHYDDVTKDHMEMLKKVCFTEKRYSYDCHRPFGYCDVIGDNVYLCCPDFLHVSAGNMRLESFMKCWDSFVARILRLSICNGTFAFCNKEYCDLFDFKDEDTLGEAEWKKIYEVTCSEYPNTLMVGIDSSCNLRCPSCRKDTYVISGKAKENAERKAEDLLENVIPYVNRLWMAGSGEVFFSSTYKGILTDERCKRRTSISILSNGTLFDESNWKLIKAAYQSIEVVISMDGIKDETIERLRKGAKAAQLKHNLEFLGKLRKRQEISKLFISCVLQAENVAEIFDLLEYCKAIGVDKVQFLKLKNNGTYRDGCAFSKASIFDESGELKKEYRQYFTEELLRHPLADWFNNTEALGVEKKSRMDEYDTF